MCFLSYSCAPDPLLLSIATLKNPLSPPPIQLSFNVFAFFKENALYSVPPMLKSLGKGNWILVRQLIRHLWPQHSAIRWGRSTNPLTNSISTRGRSPWVHVLAPRMAGEEHTHFPPPSLSRNRRLFILLSNQDEISVNSSRQSIHELIIFSESNFKKKKKTDKQYTFSSIQLCDTVSSLSSTYTATCKHPEENILNRY